MSFRHEPKIKAQLWGARTALESLCMYKSLRARLRVCWLILSRRPENLVQTAELLIQGPSLRGLALDTLELS